MSDAYSRPDMPDISQMTPATGRVGAPASGTYGEKAALTEAMAQLPAPTPGVTPPGADAAPSRGGGGPLPLAAPSGALPRMIGAPSTRPHEPMATPLTQPMPIAEEPSMQLRQQVEAWAHDPNRSDTFRAWAQSILNRMVPA